MSLVLTLQRYAQIGRRYVEAGKRVVTNTWRRAVQQERMLATTAFALIFATMLSSVDFLITAAPDWTPGGGEAYAMEPVRRATLAQPDLAPQEDIVLASVTTAAVELGDYRYTDEVLLGGPESAIPINGKFAVAEAAPVLASNHTKAL